MATKRKLFEEVGAGTAAPAAPRGGVIDRGRQGARGAIRLWLLLLFVLVVAMIQIGGLTRLTDSGLAITEWAPVTGALPPLTVEDWTAEFERYKAIPEYQLQNRGMSLAEFKTIYWWEWGHRQMGRVIGLVWAVGFVAFLALRKVPPGWTGRLLGLGALGGLQGAIGWWMVSSGLTGTALDVASYRLAVHLGLAFVILGLIAWYVFKLGQSEPALLQARRAREPRLFAVSTGLMHLAFLQILIGALVAGIDAGRSYVDWPLMNGDVFPREAFELQPLWRNLFENPALVQFVHRVTGYALAVLGVVAFLRARRSPHGATRGAAGVMLAVLAVQVAWGIWTVLNGALWEYAILHQLGAIALWVAILRLRFLAQYPRATGLREAGRPGRPTGGAARRHG